jgi:hypothetical protein
MGHVYNIYVMKYFTNLILVFFLFSFGFSLSQEKFWPHEINTNSKLITIYEPENETYINHRLKSKAAISVRNSQDATPVFGMMWTTSLLDADRSNKNANLVSIVVDEVRFPDDVSDSDQSLFKSIIEAEIPKWNIEISMDDLVNSLEEVSAHLNTLKSDAPNFIFQTVPTVLVIVDGEPKFKSIDNKYELIQNSAAFIAKEVKSNTYYLKGGDFWYVSNSIKGNWVETKKIPSKLKKYAEKASSKGLQNDSNDVYSGKAPKVLIAPSGSELILIDGAPSYAPLQNTNLLYIKNSNTDLFMNVKSQKYFILTSGRWFTAKDVKGPWSHILSDNLPSDFKNIDPDSDKANVLTSVAGTQESKSAIYDAQIPQTAAVDRSSTKATDVQYNGNASFNKIDGLNLEHAVNTESSVFKDKNTYYLCDNAIWFVSNNPNGPWTVSDKRPTEVNKIPASNPQYHTKYVYIYETTPKVVYVGYTPGYSGSYIYHNTVVYGTGYYYNPWHNGFYYHHHYTYGFNIRYDYWNGWSFGFSYGSPYAWWGYNYWRPGWSHWGPHYYRPSYYNRHHYYPSYRPPYRGRNGIHRYERPRPYNPNRRPNVRPRPMPRPTPRPRPDVRPKPMPKPAPRPNVKPKPMPKPMPKPTPRPDLRPKPMPKPMPKPTPRPDVRPKPMPKPMPKPTPRPDVKPKPMPKPMPKPTPRPNVRPKPMPRPTPRPSVRPSTRPHTNYTRPMSRPSSRPMPTHRTRMR